MTRIGATQTAVAAGFPIGALAHGWYVLANGLWYHGRAPAWAPLFWYTLCLIDLVAPVMIWRRPRAGLLLAVGVMATSLTVNLLFFPKFEDGLNFVLLSLIAFGLFVFVAAAWLWPQVPWRRSTSPVGVV